MNKTVRVRHDNLYTFLITRTSNGKKTFVFFYVHPIEKQRIKVLLDANTAVKLAKIWQEKLEQKQRRPPNPCARVPLPFTSKTRL